MTGADKVARAAKRAVVQVLMVLLGAFVAYIAWRVSLEP
jgi:hypothetical protein